ncbi:MAG: cation:proton antiporter [Gammaproteobacteria bacterium]|nr:cation:proton antiporter [Gammaproteobacteria bacterium]
MHGVVFVQDLAVIMLIAAIITVIFHRFNQPVVLGYILAGVIIGPYTPPFMFIHDEKIIKILAELGVIFLMFSLGLEFNLHKLRKVGLVAFIAAFSEIMLMILVGYGIGRLFNWSPTNSLFLGAILAISSTTIIVKALEELGMKQEEFANLIFGILIIEDIFAITILALLSTMATSGTIAVNDIFLALMKLASFLVISLIAGILLIPKILAYVANFKNKEMLLICALGLCFGFCLLVSKLNYSVALGAFLIGAIIAESHELGVIQRLVFPLKDMFSAIFFVSVGLLFDPRVLATCAIPILVITVAVVLGKIISCSLGALITGKDGRTALRVGMSLAQIGEFSFIIATLGISLNVTDKFLYPIAVAVSAFTTLLTPYLIKLSDPFSTFLAQHIPRPVQKMFRRYRTALRCFTPGDDRLGMVNLIRRSLIIILINFLIVIAIFLGFDAIPSTQMGDRLKHILGENFLIAIIWNLALILSLPFLIAIYRKLHVLCMLLAEVIFSNKQNNERFLKIRSLISYILPSLILFGFLFFLLAITQDLSIPTWLLICALIIPALLIVFLLPWFIKFHARLQMHFNEIMSKKRF